jgi:DNA repair exonuclease SbcCD ATPase subunit
MSSDVLGTYRDVVNRKLADLSVVSALLRTEKSNLTCARQEEEDVEQARALVQGVAQQIQQQAHTRIASVVCRCLEAVFDDPYEFKINFEQKRGRTEAQLVFVRDGVEIDPLSAAGGGVVDVAAFALRLSALLLTRPSLRRTIVLDEPFKFVSGEYRERLRNLLEMLAEEMQVQIIMVTHISELQVGRVVELR